MAKGSLKRGRWREWVIRAALVLALAFSPSWAWATTLSADDAQPAEQEEFTPAHPTREACLEQGLDEERAPATEPNLLEKAAAWLTGASLSSFQESGHTLFLKTTLLDAPAAGADSTFDAVYGREDWMNLIAGQYDSTLDLLDPGEDSDYLVALAAAPALNGVGSATDHTFAELSHEGVVIEDAHLDYATGIAYVPKSLYWEEGIEVPFACQLQLLVPTTVSAAPLSKTDVHVDCHDPRVQAITDQTVESCPFDVTTKIPVATPETAGYLTLADLHVRVNDSADEMALEEDVNAFWDAATGELELALSPQTLLQVSIEVDAPDLLGLMAEPAVATSTSDLAYVPEVVFDSLNLDTLTPGRVIPFDSYINYWWAHPDPNDFQWHACVNSGAYCYSWISDPDALYEYIAWADGADWSGVANRDVSNFWVDANASQASRHYFNYIFEFWSWTWEDQNFHSEKWPINNPYNYGSDWASFGLQCSHVKNPVGNGPVQEDGNGRMALRVLEVNQEAARPYVVLGFVGPAVANQPGVGIYKFEIQASGDIQLTKASADPTITQGNGSYHFEGIVYDVFSDENCTSYVCSITLDSQGRGTSKRLKEGTYYLRENATSVRDHGFAWDAKVTPVQVQKGKTTEVNVSDAPQSYGPGLLVRKVDSVTANSTPQGDGTLEGAQFRIQHFGTVTTDASQLPASPLRSWIFSTDETGCLFLDEAHWVSGDDLYRTASGDVCLPLGTLTIQEVRPPAGYHLDSQTHVVTLPSSGLEASILFTQTTTISEDILRGGVLIEKRDAESLLQSPLGSASLDGATFTITNRSPQAVCVQGVMHEAGEVVMTITAEGGSAQTASDELPYGTYGLKETAAGKGYLVSDAEERTFQIREAGALVAFAREQAALNQVKRGDVDFRKVLATDQSRLARIPFLLESKTTGERHVLVSDENGIVNTSATWRLHTAATNGNDHVLEGLETTEATQPIDADGLDLEAGCWFGLTCEGDITQPDDALGALPFDTYRLTELRSTSNAGYDLVELDGIKVTTHGLSIPLGDIEDRITPPPAITTYATNATDSSKHLFPDPEVKITDRIDYCNLTPGHEYRFTGCLMDAKSGEPLTEADGSPVTASVTHTPVASSGSCEVCFTLDATSLGGKRIVCFETVTDGTTDEVIAQHEELSDAGQSLDVIEPKINTYATDPVTGTKEMASGEALTLEDAVSYSGLQEGVEYTLQGTLMRKMAQEDGSPSAQPVQDEVGKPLTCSVTFTPTASTGRTNVSFDLDATQLEDGTDLVVYETLYKNGRAVVVHEDPTNDAQTITLRTPRIRTHAFEARSGEATCAPDARVTVTDEILYEALEVGKTYTAFGTLMMVTDEHEGTTSAAPLLDASGNKITGSHTFVASAPEGSIFVDLEVDTQGLEGVKLVAFERLTCEGRIVAAHEDPAAESQTVRVEDDREPDQPVSPRGAGGRLPRTGDGTPLGLLTLTVAAALGGSFLFQKRIRSKGESRGRHHQ